ncbi:hypothetical protein HDU87_008042 [Geranomyces variabilis]|uniref:Uncharacterized protein n=1 Tax=Geranomyces variabilis TaxID=109894 RepID=A0AAD5TP36_9FUNG|nr:hypothetical protein HDU87_008042 [Geranomyces variabilis]
MGFQSPSVVAPATDSPPPPSVVSAPRGRPRGTNGNKLSSRSDTYSSSPPARSSQPRGRRPATPRTAPGIISIAAMLALAPLRLFFTLAFAAQRAVVRLAVALGLARADGRPSEWSLLAAIDAVDRWWNTFWSWLMEICLGFPLRAAIPPANGAVLVTGAGSGIGAHVAQTLALKGYTVYAGMRTLSPDHSFRLPNLHPIQLDVTSTAQIAAAATFILNSNAGPFIGLVNCASIPPYPTPMEFVAEHDLMECLDVNVVGPLRVVQHFLPLLRRAKGRIVNVGSCARFTPNPLHGAFAASKTALETWSDSLRVEVRPHGVQVVVVQPGAVDTNLWHKSQMSSSLAAMPTIVTTPSTFRDDKHEKMYAPLHSSLNQITAETRKHLISTSHTTRAILHALFDPYPKTRYLVGVDARLAWFLGLLPDRVLDWAFWIALGKERSGA